MRTPLNALSLVSLTACISLVSACENTVRPYCAGDAFVKSEQDLADAAGCECIGGNLVIETSELSSVDKAQGLTCIEGALVIRENPALNDLSGLLGLGHVGGDVVIRENPSLPSERVTAFTRALLESGAVADENQISIFGDGSGTEPIDDDDDAEDDDGEDDDAEDDDAEDDDGEDDDAEDDEDDAEDDDAEDDDAEDDDAEDDDAEDDDAEDDDADDEECEEDEESDDSEDDADDEDDDDDGFSCDGDPACAEAALDAAVAEFTDTVSALVAQIEAAVALADAGDLEGAEVAIADALATVELAGDAFGDVLGALVEAFFAGVDDEVLGAAVEELFAGVEDAEDALLELLADIEDGDDLGDSSDLCDAVGEELEGLLDGI